MSVPVRAIVVDDSTSNEGLLFEELRRGTLESLSAYYMDTPPRGEVVILIAGSIVPGFTVDSFWSALGFSIVLSILQSILEATATKEEG